MEKTIEYFCESGSRTNSFALLSNNVFVSNLTQQGLFMRKYFTF